SGDLGGKAASMDTHVERAVGGLRKGASRVAPRRQEDDAMPARAELHRGIEDEPLRTAEAELRVREDDVHGSSTGRGADSCHASLQRVAATRATFQRSRASVPLASRAPP